MTPQQLIDMPGYGKAEQHLRATGQWDDTRIIDETGNTEYEFVVEVSGRYDPVSEHQRFTVTARSEQEAYDLACEQCDFDHIEGEEIVSVKEAT